MLFGGRGTQASGGRSQLAAMLAAWLLLAGTGCGASPAVSLEADASATPGRGSGAVGQAAHPTGRIAFVRGGDVYVIDAAAGVERRLTQDGAAAAPWWSVDGRQLFFEKDSGGQQHTWRWRPDSGAAEVPTGVWSPDGTKVAVTQSTGDMRGPSSVGVEENGRRTQVTPSEPDASWTPLAWSPDGSRLALARRHLVPSPVSTYTGLYPADGALWLADSTGGHRLQVLLPTEWDGSVQNGWPDAVSWAPAGQSLVVWVGPPQPCTSCRADGTPIVGVRRSDGSVHGLGSSLGPGFLAWLPSGEAVVVEPWGRETYVDKHLVRVDPATGARVQLTDDADYADVEPVVSPDGRRIAFTRGRAQQPWAGSGTPVPSKTPSPEPGNLPLELIKSRHIWQMAANGSDPRQLTDSADWTDESPVWTADGQWLIFVRWRAPASEQPVAELWAVRPDGSAAQRVVAGLDIPPGFHNGFGYYGALGWKRLFAVAPG